jgi:hypothetical protein
MKMTNAPRISLLIAAGLPLSAAGADTVKIPTETPDYVAGIGNLDNDKDLDLAILQAYSAGFYPVINGVEQALIAVPKGAVDIAVVDLDQKENSDGDTFDDVVILTRDVDNNVSEVHIWLNQGREPGQDWQGLQKFTTSLDFPGVTFTSIAVGDFLNSDGFVDVFVFDRNSRRYSIARNDQITGTNWNGMTKDSVFTVAQKESLEVALGPEDGDGVFVLVDDANDRHVKKYTFGSGF